MTIEERANSIYLPREEKSFFDTRYNKENAERKNIYIKGAIEQESITRNEIIEKAYNYLLSGNVLIELINIKDAQSRWDFCQKFKKIMEDKTTDNI